MASVLRDVLPEGSPRPRLVLDPDAGDFLLTPGPGRRAEVPSAAQMYDAAVRHTDVVRRAELAHARLVVWLTARGWEEEVAGQVADAPAPALIGVVPTAWGSLGELASARTAANPVFLVMWAYSRAARTPVGASVLASDVDARQVLAPLLAAHVRGARSADEAVRSAAVLARAYHRVASRAWQADPVPGLAPAVADQLGAVLRGSGLELPRQI